VVFSLPVAAVSVAATVLLSLLQESKNKIKHVNARWIVFILLLI
jgi:hypothetical protein